MATTLTAADLREPVGQLPDGIFPAGSTSAGIDTILAAYLADADTRATAAAISDQTALDDYARAWAYHRAYHARWIEMLSDPASQSEDGQGSATYTQGQIAAMGELAERYRAAAETLLPVDAGGTVAAPARVTRTQTHDFAW